MPISRARMCWLCKGASGSSSNVDKHCSRHHTHLTDCVGEMPSGFIWRVMEGNDSMIVAVAAEHPGKNTRNVMYCFDCKRMYEVSTAIKDPMRIFERHCTSGDGIYECVAQGESKPSKRKGLILGPRKKDGMATSAAPAPVRKDGIWLDKALLDSIKAKYPALANCYVDVGKDDATVLDFIKTLEAMGSEVQEAENYQRAQRDLKTGNVKPSKERSADPWADVGRILLEDEKMSDGYDQLTASVTRMFNSELEDWKLARNKDAIQKGLPTPFPDVEVDDDDDMDVEPEDLLPPDANIHRRVIRDAVAAEVRKLNAVSKRRPPPILEMRPAPAETSLPVAAPASSDCPPESGVHLRVEEC